MQSLQSVIRHLRIVACTLLAVMLLGVLVVRCHPTVAQTGETQAIVTTIGSRYSAIAAAA